MERSRARRTLLPVGTVALVIALLSASLERSVAIAYAASPSAAASSSTSAQPPSVPVGDERTTKARAEFAAGAEFVKAAQWGEALAAFERSAALRPHALTTYNIGACERALGRYTRARKTLHAALAQNEAAGRKDLPTSYEDEANAFIGEIDKVVVHVAVSLAPVGATLAIDGRPLVEESPGVWVAGVAPPGPGKPIVDQNPTGPQKFQLIADPGAHVVVVAHKGFNDAALSESWPAGAHESLKLELDKLPGKLVVESDQPGATVTVSGVDVGVAPIDLSRPAGRYDVVVRKVGFEAYRAEVDLQAGERFDLRARLVEETTPLTKKWWFWTTAAAVVTSVGIATYFITRPAPERPPLDGGGLGWVVHAQ